MGTGFVLIYFKDVSYNLPRNVMIPRREEKNMSRDENKKLQTQVYIRIEQREMTTLGILETFFFFFVWFLLQLSLEPLPRHFVARENPSYRLSLATRPVLGVTSWSRRLNTVRAISRSYHVRSISRRPGDTAGPRPAESPARNPTWCRRGRFKQKWSRSEDPFESEKMPFSSFSKGVPDGTVLGTGHSPSPIDRYELKTITDRSNCLLFVIDVW